MCIATNCSRSFVYWVNLECIFVTSCVLSHCTACTAVLHTLDAGLLAVSQYPEGPAPGHLGTGFFLVSLFLQANVEMVPKNPSC